MSNSITAKARERANTSRLEAFKPLSGMVLPRFAGISTFMRLPHLDPIEAPGIRPIELPVVTAKAVDEAGIFSRMMEGVFSLLD